MEETEQKQDAVLFRHQEDLKQYEFKIEKILLWMDRVEESHYMMDTEYTIAVEDWKKFRELVMKPI